MMLICMFLGLCILIIGGGVILVDFYDPYVKNHTDYQKMLIHKMNVKNRTVPEIDLSSMPKPRKIEAVPVSIITVAEPMDKNDKPEVIPKKPPIKMVTKQRKVVCPHCLGTKSEEDECPYCGIG